jgi:hypothetical protein
MDIFLVVSLCEAYISLLFVRSIAYRWQWDPNWPLSLRGTPLEFEWDDRTDLHVIFLCLKLWTDLLLVESWPLASFNRQCGLFRRESFLKWRDWGSFLLLDWLFFFIPPGLLRSPAFKSSPIEKPLGLCYTQYSCTDDVMCREAWHCSAYILKSTNTLAFAKKKLLPRTVF